MKNLILLLFALFPVCSVFARDVTVILIEEDSGKAASGLMVGAMTQNGETICQGEETDTDGTYLLKGIELNSYLIYYGVNGKMKAEFVATPVDSVTYRVHPKYLPLKPGEVEVSANNQYITDEKTVYVPTKRDKKIAYGGSSLLQFMGISSLYIDPMSQKISTASGEAVRTFIDYVPATDQDIANLRPMDVLRVEMFDYPQDPRFRGAAHALNFVMVKYEYGGYTKFDGEQRIISHNGTYTVSSKLVKDKMTYDAAANFSYNNYTHEGREAQTTYRFPAYDLVKHEKTIDSESKKRNGYGAIRAIYNSKKSLIINSFGINVSKNPLNDYKNYTQFFPNNYYGDGIDERHVVRNSVSPSWNGSYLWYMPRNYSLSIDPKFAYGHYSNSNTFLSNDAVINNDVKENNINYSLAATVRKQIKKHSINLSLLVSGTWDDLKYQGTTPSHVIYNDIYSGIGISANLKFDKSWISTYVTAKYSHASFSGISKNQIVPFFILAAGHKFNPKHQMSITLSYNSQDIPVNEQSPNLVLSNQIEASQGNAHLKNSNLFMSNLNYEWLASKHISFSLYGAFSRHANIITPVYIPLNTSLRPIMVRSVNNSGFYNLASYGGAVTLRLFQNSLVMRGGIDGLSATRHEGINMSGNYVNYKFDASYSWKNFYCSASYISTKKNLGVNSFSKSPSYYYFSIGWGNGDLNFSAYAINPFTSSWNSLYTVYGDAHYIKQSQAISIGYHRQFALRLSYSFSYGKKIQRTESIGSLSGTSSGIVE